MRERGTDGVSGGASTSDTNVDPFLKSDRDVDPNSAAGGPLIGDPPSRQTAWTSLSIAWHEATEMSLMRSGDGASRRRRTCARVTGSRDDDLHLLLPDHRRVRVSLRVYGAGDLQVRGAPRQ